jgi:hypothetical protein
MLPPKAAEGLIYGNRAVWSTLHIRSDFRGHVSSRCVLGCPSSANCPWRGKSSEDRNGNCDTNSCAERSSSWRPERLRRHNVWPAQPGGRRHPRACVCAE